MRHRNPTILCLCLLLVGCGRYFAPDRNVKRQVTTAEVVGTWKLAQSSLALLQRDGFQTAPTHAYTITFNPDGTVLFSSVLDGPQSGTYVSGTGTWKLLHDTTGNSNVQKKNVVEIDVTIGNTSYLRVLNFTEEEGPLLLWNYYGDPDQWEFIEYSKQAR